MRIKYLRSFRKNINKLIIKTLTMKKSKILYRIFPSLMLFVSVVFNGFGAGPAKQQYYEIKIYRIADKTQEGMVDAYLKDAYLPALHRAGISIIGVFKPVEADTAFGKLIYVFIPFKTMDQFMQLPDQLLNDKVYTVAGRSFIDAPFHSPPYQTAETILSKASSHMPPS